MGMVVVGILMLATVAAFTTNVNAVRHAETTTRASIFLQATMEDLTAQSYDALLALDGDTIYDDNGPEDSSYSIDLTVFVADVDLVQVTAGLNDLRTTRRLAEVTTLRTRR